MRNRSEPNLEEDTMKRDEQMHPVGDNGPPGETKSALPGAEQRPRRLVSRRALVRAGWTVPVVLALNALPVKAFAASGTCTIHTDTSAHSDNGIVGVGHVDANLHTDTCA
jgi:hypothetical protein